jgi:YggT family protein
MPINPSNPLVIALHEITEPILAPIRQVLPRFGMIDLSPMVAIIVLNLIGQVVQNL